MESENQREPMQAIVIGGGHFGKFHTEKYALHPEVSFLGVVDSNLSAAEQLCEQWGGKAYPSLEALDTPIHLASIATPARTHFALASEVLNRGAHVLVEKPIATNLENADQLIQLAREKNRILQVNHQERYFLYEAGMPDCLAPLKKIQVRRLGPPPPKPSDCSVILDILIHDLDWILAFQKKPPREVEVQEAHKGSSGFFETVRCRLAFEGVEVFLEGSRNHSERRRTAHLETERGDVEINFMDRTVFHSGEKQWYPPSKEKFSELYGEHPFAREDYVGKSIAHFIHCCQTGGSPQVNGEAGRQALETTLALEAACHSFVK